jgi:hypothetical protein
VVTALLLLVAVAWAASAAGVKAAIANATVQLIDFKTRKFMRLSSAILLMIVG